MNRSQTVRECIARKLDLPASRLNDQVELLSVVHGSFALVELVIELQEELDVHFGQSDMLNTETVGDFIRLFTQRMPAEPVEQPS